MSDTISYGPRWAPVFSVMPENADYTWVKDPNRRRRHVFWWIAAPPDASAGARPHNKRSVSFRATGHAHAATTELAQERLDRDDLLRRPHARTDLDFA
jgi:hypothetical protein